jgi:hypothetical protein
MVSGNPKGDNVVAENFFQEISDDEPNREEVILMELAFDQFEFDAKVKITAENYDLIRQVFIYAFTKGREA